VKIWIKWTGISAVILFFVIAYVSSLYNPWFSIWHNAYSDLGTTHAKNMWIFNYGLMFIVSPLMLIFAIYLIYKSENKLQTVGGSFITMAAIFIFFIGLFHKGTGPHDFVALWFFWQYFIGIPLYCIGRGKTWLGITLFALFIAGFLIPFPSIALAETYALVLIGMFNVGIGTKA